MSQASTRQSGRSQAWKPGLGQRSGLRHRSVVARWLAVCAALVAAASVPGGTAAASHPKKRLLLVTTSIGFRHPSTGFASAVVKKRALDSGDFEVVSTADDPDFPVYPAPPPRVVEPGSAGSPEVLAKITKVLAKYMTADGLRRFEIGRAHV